MRLAVDPQRMLSDLKTLAAFGKVGTGVNRRALTQIDMEARHWLVERMRAAGLEAWIDGVGTVIGRTNHPRRILIGSHTDTVPDGGWLDGALGVIYGLEIARCVQAQHGDIGVEVASFSDEEGHYGVLLGSRSFCGAFDPARDAACNAAGETLGQVLARTNLAGRPLARLDAHIHIAYLEAHIEQGPVLEARGVEIGVVTHIVGRREHRVSFTGQANHAGTTPMSMRRDAAMALLHFGVALNKACASLKDAEAVWTISQLSSEPAASNVTPSRAACVVEFRSADEAVLETIAGLVETHAALAAQAHQLQSRADHVAGLRVTAMDPTLTDAVELAARDLQATALRMPSGAGHDAMQLALHLPTAMLFIPSRGGVSHSIEEDSLETSLIQGLQVLARTVERLAEAQTKEEVAP